MADNQPGNKEPGSREPEDKGFKVVDRRGRSEPASDSAAAAPPPEPSAPSTGEVHAVEGGSHEEVLGRIDFQTFLVSLASSALIHLGVAPHPETGQPDASLPHAQQTIDLLALLQEKTRGNLSEDEAKLLQALLRDLRLRFVQATSL